ncbi:MAG: histidine phosphatase family protein [Magnetococcales bacterium]|nr:histidine phosphatase family protein [Magnetococcales bacterium]
MSYQLLLMRHAKSAWDTDARTDFERPLADRGQKDAPRMGDWLKKEKLVPEYIVSSSAERAKQTAVMVCDVLDIKHKRINWDVRIYGAGTEELLEVLANVPAKTKSVLMVGHNPGLEFLFSHLVGSNKHNDFDVGLIKTATIVHLKVPEDWSALNAGCATLVTVKHPKDLS